MNRFQRLPRNLAALFTFSRPLLVFSSFACALWLMATNFPPAYMLGATFLLLATTFDWIDGWFAERYLPDSRLGALVDRMMDRMVLSIIFPVLGAGMFWRYTRVKPLLENPDEVRLALLHAIFVLGICVIVLLRDQFSQFLRNFAKSAGRELEVHELTRLRTMVASPVAALLYAYAFYQPTQGWEVFYHWISWIDKIPLRLLLVGEIVFLIITIASVTLHMRKYGALALDEICEDDEELRRRILSVIPNTLTLMNGVLGVAAVVFASYGLVTEALFILIGAGFFDRLDGLVARRLGLSVPSEKSGKRPNTGALLDDVSDAISFALAPALIFYIVFSQLPLGTLPWALVPAVALLYAAAGISRLIYFTFDKKPIPGFFKGIPVPAAALLATSVIEIVHQVHLYLPQYLDLALRLGFGAMVVWAVMMNLFPLRYLHIGRWFGRNPVFMWGAVGLWLGMVFTPFYGVTVLAICGVYLISPLFTGRISPEAAEIEQRLRRGNPMR